MEMIKIDEIVVRPNRRAVGDITELKESIAKFGLTNLITVQKKSEGFFLIAGNHRLQACKALGWDAIPANVFAVDDLHAALIEIDENIVRKRLNVLEEALAHARRKKIYEEINPSTRQGGNSGLQGGGKKARNENIASFAKDTALKINKNVKTVQNLIKIGNKISNEVATLLCDHELSDSKCNLMKLSDYSPEDQRRIAQQIIAGEIKKVPKFIKKSVETPAVDKNLPQKKVQTARQTPMGRTSIEGLITTLSNSIQDFRDLINKVTKHPETGDSFGEESAFFNYCTSVIELLNKLDHHIENTVRGK